MRTFLIVFSVLFVVAAALFYAETRSRHQMVVSTTEETREPETNPEIRAALIEHFGADANGIQVRERDHAVALFGEVSQRSTQELAEEVVMSLDGIVVVHNFLDLHASEVDTAQELITHAELEARDAMLETGVKTRLTSDIGDEAFDISVEACDGVVSLRGDLPDQERHAVAIRTAGSVDGVRKVIDLLEVTA